MATSRDIEREVESQRASVESTLEALKSKMSVGQIVDEFGGYVSKDDAKHAMRNVGRQVRDNPLAFGLVGVGLAWLMMGGGGRRSSHASDWEDRRYSAPVGGETAYVDRGYDRTGHSEGATPGMTGDQRYGSAFGTPYQGGPGYSGENYSRSGGGGGVLSKVTKTVTGAASAVTGAASAVGGAVSTAGGALASAGSTLVSAGSTAAEKLSSAGSAAAGVVSSAGSAVTGAVSGAGERVRYATDASGRRIADVGQGLGAQGRNLSQQGQRMGDTLMDTLERQPLLVGGFALVVGVAIGAALPATRTEDRLLGEQRDDIMDEAKRTIGDLKDQAVDAARAGMQAASRAAEEEGLTPTAEGKTLAAKVETVVRAAVDEAKHNLESVDVASDLSRG